LVADFTPAAAIAGGMLIGLASALLLWANGRIAGISGIFGGLLAPARGDFAWRALFVSGLVLGGLVMPLLTGHSVPFSAPAGTFTPLIAGFLVGFGTRMGGGCTSGHGVCGLARGSKRSIVATAVFMAFAALTVLVVRYVRGA
jgi:uncharacterized membrane protein YedE/YeeE